MIEPSEKIQKIIDKIANESGGYETKDCYKVVYELWLEARKEGYRDGWHEALKGDN